ncbi:hypothetical protein CMEL01_09968 [Colletotrichum melonis]|uniref:Uncharacterized protein n=1 Tax=Colletotrichum melonis TaxID=1209925 RepID=A0AAI9TW54_9PEZI|nr:hypothetical protein CMEL01_09968 [Colletotrichum melonis]
MVLEKLPPLAKERHEMARWSSVSKEWQCFFEAGIFQSLSIRPCRREIGRMDQVVRGYRMKLVRNITLLIGTAEFTGAEYNQREEVDTVAAINVVVKKALTALFSFQCFRNGEKQHLNTTSHWNFVLALTLTTTACALATSFIDTLVTEHRRTGLEFLDIGGRNGGNAYAQARNNGSLQSNGAIFILSSTRYWGR